MKVGGRFHVCRLCICYTASQGCKKVSKPPTFGKLCWLLNVAEVLLPAEEEPAALCRPFSHTSFFFLFLQRRSLCDGTTYVIAWEYPSCIYRHLNSAHKNTCPLECIIDVGYIERDSPRSLGSRSTWPAQLISSYYITRKVEPVSGLPTSPMSGCCCFSVLLLFSNYYSLNWFPLL